MNIKNLTEVSPADFTLMPEDYAIKSKVNNKIYVTSDSYMSKLFADLGYKDLREVETLIKYGYPIKTELKLKTLGIYTDEETEEFICMTPHAFKWYQDMMSLFSLFREVRMSGKDEDPVPVYELVCADDAKNCQYILYFNFIKETFELYAMFESRTLTKIHRASMKNDEGDCDIIKDTLKNIDLYVSYPPELVSYDTALKVLEKAHLVKKKGKMYVSKDPDMRLFSSQISVDEFLEKIFEKNFSEGVAQKDLCDIIQTETVNKNIPLRDFLFFFAGN